MKKQTKKIQPVIIMITLLLWICVIVGVSFFIYNKFIKKGKNVSSTQKPKTTHSPIKSFSNNVIIDPITSTIMPTTTTIMPTTTTMTPITTINPYRWAYMNPSFMECCYSMRLVVPTYTGPVVRLEMEDGTLLDFYTDATQSYISTGINNTGTSMSSVIGIEVGTGNVRIWYDQSGNGNHAVCTDDMCRPFAAKDEISSFMKYVLGFSYVPGGSVFSLQLQKSIRPYTICSQFYWNKSATGSYGTIVSSTENPGFGVRFYNKMITSEENEYDWFYQGGGNKYSLLNGSSTDQLLALKVWTTLCLSVQEPDNTLIDIIGTDTGTSSRSFSGFISEFIFYNRQLTTSEMDEYYTNRFDPNV